MFGCEVLEVLHEGNRSVVYRGRRRADGLPVVIKTSREEVQHHQRLQALRAELDVLRRLDGCEAAVRAYTLERAGNRWALLLEDFDARSLRLWSGSRPLSVSELVRTARALVAVVDALHRERVIHRDLTPDNLVIEPDSGRVKAIDFACATLVGDELRAFAATGRREGTVAYMSPEQTGRMNRLVDYRTDYYSLGVILFELLTGQLPFPCHDALECLHSHVARECPDPRSLRTGIPQALASILLKLLSKDADERYQSLEGLGHDLRRCEEELALGHAEFDFDLAAEDRTEEFRLPQRLYGREATIARLHGAFERVCTGERVVVTVSGAAGVGKSALVRELIRPVTARRGYFAEGKWDQYEQSVPYAGLRQALDALVAQMLTEGADSLIEWRSRIVDAVPGASQVLVQLCPSFELVLGPQPESAPLAPSEARTRLEHTLASFLSVVAREEHPLCLFLDDVQWAGDDSFRLIRELIASGRRLHLLMVIAHRELEPGKQQLLDAVVEAGAGSPDDRLELEPLTLQDVTAMVGDGLSGEGDPVTLLARIVYARTAGNPFFTRAFLASIHADGLLRDRGPDAHRVDLDRIRQRGVTDNVVDLLLERIHQLPPSTQSALKLAACLGTRFELPVVNLLAGRQVGADLAPALAAELVLPLEHAPASAESTGASSAIGFRFAHDRIQQAVMCLMDDSERLELHLRVGRRLREQLSERGERTSRLFQVVAHLNQALPLIDDAAERTALAALDLEAARVALGRAAGAEAFGLARAGVAALGADAWHRHHASMRDLREAQAEAALALADHETVEQIAQEMLAMSRAPIDTARVRRLQGQVYYSQFRIGEAIQIHLEALEQLGIRLPRHPSAEEIAEELRETRALVSGIDVEQLLALPECRDPVVLLAMELLSKLLLFAISASDDRFQLLICRAIKLSLERGNTPESAAAYTHYGLLSSLEQDIDSACRFGQLAMDLSERLGKGAIQAQTHLAVTYLIMHWKVPLAELAASFRRAHHVALESGIPFESANSATSISICRFLAGDRLAELGADLERDRVLVVRLRQPLVLNWHDIYLQAVCNLRSEPTDPTRLAGTWYDEEQRLPVHHAAGDQSALFNYYVAKSVLCYLFADPAGALTAAEASRNFPPVYLTSLSAIFMTYMHALCCLAACEGVGAARRGELIARAAADVEKLRAWAPYNPRAVDHKLATLTAELARAAGDREQSVKLFARAADLAQASGAPHEEGIACELAARASLEAGDHAAARAYSRAAHRAYFRWGAISKVKLLERQNRHLIAPTIPGPLDPSAVADAQNGIDMLDLVGAFNASRAISGEIKLERLLQRLMTLLLESGGAQLGYLLLPKDGHWLVEAGQTAEGQALPLLRSIPMDEVGVHFGGIARSIVNYVARTGAPLLLDDASRSDRFRQDAQVTKRGVASVLCFPLRRQGETCAIAYLENNLARHAFTRASLHVLEMLCAQATISLENARLYELLEQKVQIRTRELEEKNGELGSTLATLVNLQRQMVTQEKLAALGALTAGIAHEIKNPLNFVTNFANISSRLTSDISGRLSRHAGDLPQALRGELEDLTGDLVQAVNKIEEHALRATAIINGMALHARSGNDRREAADLNSILAQTISLATHKLARERVSIEGCYDPELGEVEMVVQDISRVFVNLITNAQHALAKKRERLGDGFAPAIGITTKRLGELAVVRVRDNGVGIARDLMDKIFLPFFTTKPSGQGTGLGLSISHDIVVRGHGGDLRAESVEGEFAEFTVVLPTRPPPPPRRVRRD